MAALPCPALPMQEAGGGGLATKALRPAGPGVTAWLGCRQQREASGWASPGQQPRCSSWAFLQTPLPLEPELQITGWGF